MNELFLAECWPAVHTADANGASTDQQHVTGCLILNVNRLNSFEPHRRNLSSTFVFYLRGKDSPEDTQDNVSLSTMTNRFRAFRRVSLVYFRLTVFDRGGKNDRRGIMVLNAAIISLAGRTS